MEKYDPGKPIDTDEWLALDEADSIGLVQIFHEEHDEELPEDALTMHSSIHVVVENQLAMGVEPIPETFTKLIRQGLDRHDAIHAIGAIIAEDMFDLVAGNVQEVSSKKYRRRLEKITAKGWRKGQY